MRQAWLIVGVLAGCSTVATQETETKGASQSSEAAGEGETGGSSDPSSATGSTGFAPTSEATTDDPNGTSTVDSLSGSGDTGAGSTGTDDAMPTAGCGGDPGGVGPQNRVVMIEGVERKYTVVVPPGYDPAAALPVVFAWHGRGSDGKTARLYFKIEEAADGAAILVYPDGLPLADMDNQTGWDLTPDGVDVAFFDAMLADVSGTLCVDAGRVFSAGHSFGGFMSNALGCFRGGVVRGIAPVAGGGPFGACTGQVAA